MLDPQFRHEPRSSGSHGEEVAGWCELANFAPDPEQRMILDATFAYSGRHNRPTAFEIGVIAPRQNLKTGLLKQAALGWTFHLGVPLLVWTAHESATATESFNDLKALIEGSRYLSREVKRIREGQGKELIELKGSRRIVFRARTKMAGKGLTGDVVVLDEAFALHPSHMGSLLPTLATRPRSQVVYASSAGYPASGVLRGVRERGRKGVGSKLAYYEWGDANPDGSHDPCATDGCEHHPGTPGCCYDDEARWARIMPALGRRIEVDKIRDFRAAMTPEEFGREFMGRWEDPIADDGDGITAVVWLACEDASAAPSGPLSWAVDVSPGGTWASVVVCGDGVLELVERRRGTDWLPGRLAELADDHHVTGFACDPQGPLGQILPALNSANVPLAMVDGRDSVRACGALAQAVRDRTVRHRGGSEFLSAVSGATRRRVGDGWKWARVDSSADISPLVAATLAHWAHLDGRDTPIEPDIFFV